MLLIDALYINVGGGKVLLDYLISQLNNTGESIHYLLDERIRDAHEPIRCGTVQYQKASVWGRLSFYRRNKQKFQRVLCFGNLPPSVKINAVVYTYFHQPLFLAFSKELPLLQRILLQAKIAYLRTLVKNTDFWMVQTDMIKKKLAEKYKLNNPGYSILVLPFYPSLALKVEAPVQRKNTFIYVSNGEAHKNHQRLLEAFTGLYDETPAAELHLTVEARFTTVCRQIEVLQAKGYPIVNHGNIPHEDLRLLYYESAWLIYPSLTESFGLGIVEAIECGCKIIGADRPYMYAVCVPSATFNPESTTDIQNALHRALQDELPDSKQLVFDNVRELISELLGKEE